MQRRFPNSSSPIPIFLKRSWGRCQSDRRHVRRTHLSSRSNPTRGISFGRLVFDWNGFRGPQARRSVAGDRDSSSASLALQQHLKYWQEMREAGRCLVLLSFRDRLDHFGVCSVLKSRRRTTELDSGGSHGEVPTDPSSNHAAIPLQRGGFRAEIGRRTQKRAKNGCGSPEIDRSGRW